MANEYFELKPCPSCGEKRDLHIIASLSWTTYSVMCWKCDYETRSLSSEDAAVRYWNELKREAEVRGA